MQEGNKSNYVMEASFLYRLSLDMLPSGPKDGMNAPRNLNLQGSGDCTLYLCSLYERLDKCVQNVTKAARRCDVVMHADPNFE